MKENIFALGLLCIEVAFFYILNLIVDLPQNLFIKICFMWLVTMFIFKHFKIQSTLVWEEISSDLKAGLYFLIIAIIYTYPNTHYYLSILGIDCFMFIIAIFANRTIRIIFRKYLARKTLIIGTGSEAYRIARIAHNNRFALTDVVGFIRSKEEFCEDLKNDPEFEIYEKSQLDNVLTSKKIDQVIIALPQTSKEALDNVSRDLFNKVKIIKIAPQLNFTMTFNSKINDFDGELLISTSRGKLGRLEGILKRIIDICAGLCGCILLVPLTAYVSHMNKKSGDYDPIFFKQKRIGRDGKEFEIYKYRSMVPHAEEVLEELMEKDPQIKEEYLTNKKLVNDPRITKVGQFLRKKSLDEFPQFINVLKGEMSLVGPRPYLPREKDDMDIYYESIVKCKPGITGMWQANGRSDVGFIDRCKLDDYYYRNWTIGLDMIIVYKTIKSVIYGKGAL